MPIAVSCPCGMSYDVREEFAGRQVSCTSCSRVLTIPRAPLPTPQHPAPYVPPPVSPPPPQFETPPSSAPLVIGVGLFFLLLGVAAVVLFNLDAIKEMLDGEPAPQAAVASPPEQRGRDERKTEEKPPLKKTEQPRDPPKDPQKDAGPRRPPDDKKPDDKKPDDKKPLGGDGIRPPDKRPPEAGTPFAGHTDSVFRVGFTKDGAFVMSASGGVREQEGQREPAADSSVRLWHPTGVPVKKLNAFPTGVSAAAFSPGGRFFLVVGVGKSVEGKWTPGVDHDLHLWDMEEGREVRAFSGHIREPMCLAISADSRSAISGGRDRVLRVWEMKTGKEINRLVGHANTVNCVAFTPDGKRAISGSSDYSVRLWDVERGKELQKFDSHQDIVWAVAVSADGKFAVSAGGYQPSQSGGGLAPGAKDFALRLWDLDELKEVRKFEGHTEAVAAVAFSPDGRRLVSVGADKAVRLWQVSTGKLLRSFTGHTKLVHTVAIAPDGRLAVSGGDDGLRSWPLPPEPTELVRLLKVDTDPEKLTRAVDDLKVYGEAAVEAIPDLLRLLLIDNERLRKSILSALEQAGKPKVAHIPLLIPLLKAGLPIEVRRLSLESLTSLEAAARPAGADLAELLKDEMPAIRSAAAKALGAMGKVGRAVSWTRLIDTLRDREAAVSTAAREALDRLGAPQASDLPTFQGLLTDPADPVRKFALDALLTLKEAAEPASEALSRVAQKDAQAELRRLALQAMATATPRARASIDVFRKGLADKDALVARQASTALASAPIDLALEGLLAALDHADAEVVKSAGEALDKVIWEKAQAKKLGEVLSSTGSAGRARLLMALGGLAADAADALPALRELVKKADPKEQLALVTTLAKMGLAAKEAGPDLLPLLKRDPKDKDGILPMETAYTLLEIGAGELGKGEAIGAIVSSIRTENEEDEAAKERREKAMKTLVKLGKPAIPRLLRALEGEFGPGLVSQIPPLIRGFARLRIVQVLTEMGPKVAGTNEVLVALAQMERREPFPIVRQAARDARLALLKKE